MVIAVAIVIDVMKLAALSFVAPGMAKEYGLKAATNPHGHLPVAILTTVLYGFWSSKKTIIASFAVLAVALAGFVIAGTSLAHNHVLLTALLVVPLSGTSVVAAITTVPASEIYVRLGRARRMPTDPGRSLRC